MGYYLNQITDMSNSMDDAMEYLDEMVIEIQSVKNILLNSAGNQIELMNEDLDVAISSYNEIKNAIKTAQAEIAMRAVKYDGWYSKYQALGGKKSTSDIDGTTIIDNTAYNIKSNGIIYKDVYRMIVTPNPLTKTLDTTTSTSESKIPEMICFTGGPGTIVYL